VVVVADQLISARRQAGYPHVDIARAFTAPVDVMKPAVGDGLPNRTTGRTTSAAEVVAAHAMNVVSSVSGAGVEREVHTGAVDSRGIRWINAPSTPLDPSSHAKSCMYISVSPKNTLPHQPSLTVPGTVMTFSGVLPHWGRPRSTFRWRELGSAEALAARKIENRVAKYARFVHMIFSSQDRKLIGMA
jgi:hypothetical protein